MGTVTAIHFLLMSPSSWQTQTLRPLIQYGSMDSLIFANLAHHVRLDFRMAGNRRFACTIGVCVDCMIAALALELTVMVMQVLEQFIALHAGTGC